MVYFLDILWIANLVEYNLETMCVEKSSDVVFDEAKVIKEIELIMMNRMRK